MRKLLVLLCLFATSALGSQATTELQQQQLDVLNEIETNTAGSGGSTTATGSNQKKGKITCSALTGSYATLVSVTFNTCIVLVFNSCDNTLLLSLDSGTTDFAELEAGESLGLDLCANGRHVASGVTIQAKHGGVAPTAGTLRASIAG
jgi:hypothetical protein